MSGAESILEESQIERFIALVDKGELPREDFGSSRNPPLGLEYVVREG